jgi:head-tail adaptor
MALRTFLARTFAALGTFGAGTFTGQGTDHPSGRPGLQTFSARTFSALDTFAEDTFGGMPMHVAQVIGGGPVPMGCIPTYAPNLIFDNDYLVWDNTSTVSYVSVDLKDGDQNFCPSGCHRHAISRKELAASDGVYTPDDVVLRIPRPMLAVKPKPRDRWTDEEGETFTVLEVGRIVGVQRYRLVCRNLILAHELDDLITIQRASISYDAAGVKIKTWGPLVTNLECRVQPVSSSIVDERGVRGFKVSHEIIISQEVSITNEDRILLKSGQYLEVRGYQQSERIDELPRILAEAVP